ncbi:uncharacterized protein UMAG_05394 [Mycosarcoma maydis]|uniref:Uncharacterized protein n=1 Tax=Mycosarcoma maydis TaxID=5270 RepID=Q7ZA71_MYCMD|nr:uncharacterized protein UMAG_05394 [Ustilago maydis 521]KIS66401.1 hypothetical protein UMAG_05394 [Ustilago maydis 521]CAD91456.1 putative protein [Ustilago maydis]|eukprot:XP_011392087.1 hypothetical protein UMAG_05394 [Ustilago maydis 521]
MRSHIVVGSHVTCRVLIVRRILRLRLNLSQTRPILTYHQHSHFAIRDSALTRSESCVRDERLKTRITTPPNSQVSHGRRLDPNETHPHLGSVTTAKAVSCFRSDPRTTPETDSPANFLPERAGRVNMFVV